MVARTRPPWLRKQTCTLPANTARAQSFVGHDEMTTNVSSARGAWQKYARSVRRADDGGGGRVVVVVVGVVVVVRVGVMHKVDVRVSGMFSVAAADGEGVAVGVAHAAVTVLLLR